MSYALRRNVIFRTARIQGSASRSLSLAFLGWVDIAQIESPGDSAPPGDFSAISACEQSVRVSRRKRYTLPLPTWPSCSCGMANSRNSQVGDRWLAGGGRQQCLCLQPFRSATSELRQHPGRDRPPTSNTAFRREFSVHDGSRAHTCLPDRKGPMSVLAQEFPTPKS